LELNSSGTEAFYEATKAGGQIAIVLDGKVISAPRASSAIPDGKAIISGNFTLDEASNLSSLIRGGALPVEMIEVQTDIIGPTLGLDAMTKSISAAKVGLAFIVLFLIGYYKLPGFIASISLVFYASLILVIMSAFGATLTLPGIAGLILSIGMAVDANVIIFERLKEELKNGKTVRSSLNFAFKRAMSTIVDANVTTLIAGIVLFNFGQGPIKGFAVTLMIGIVVSMFTAIVITKAMLINGLAIDAFHKKNLYRG
jgi:preprotein translocase subunit SecD